MCACLDTSGGAVVLLHLHDLVQDLVEAVGDLELLRGKAGAVQANNCQRTASAEVAAGG